jgi:hypothetical protein
VVRNSFFFGGGGGQQSMLKFFAQDPVRNNLSFDISLGNFLSMVNLIFF